MVELRSIFTLLRLALRSRSVFSRFRLRALAPDQVSGIKGGIIIFFFLYFSKQALNTGHFVRPRLVKYWKRKRKEFQEEFWSMFVHYKRLFQVFYKLPSTSVTTPQLWLRLHVLKMLVPAFFSTIILPLQHTESIWYRYWYKEIE